MPRLKFLRPLIAAICINSTHGAHAAPSPLPPEVDAALAQAKVPRESLVLVVQEVSASTPRLAWQPNTPVNPASLIKLLTTTAALDLLGPAWSWSTPVWLDGSTQHGVLEGNLVIKGSGDPKLVQERLWLLLRRVQQLGVREIRGDIVLDRSALQVPEQQPADFDGEALRPYNALPDALLLNYKSIVLTFTPDAERGVARVSLEPPMAGVRIEGHVPLLKNGCDDWRGHLKADFGDGSRIHFKGGFAASCGEKTWPVAFADPKTYNARVLAGLWREMGGKLSGRVRDGTAPSTPPSFEVSSPTLAEVVRDINKHSNNVMAQQLYLTLGLTQRGSGTAEAARAVMQQWLTERHGEAASSAVIANGSGLSLDSRVSAQLLARQLQLSWASPVMPELMSSLPVSGIDGTLRKARGSAVGRAHLKTGSMPKSGIAGIAGYVLANSGKRYVLVAVINHPNAALARPALEALVQWAAADTAAPAAAVSGGTR